MTKLRRNSDNKPEAASKRNAKKEVDVVKKDLFKNLKKIGKKNTVIFDDCWFGWSVCLFC